jgi:hypothetical protein
MQTGEATRQFDSKIALCGGVLIVMRVAISAQLHLNCSANVVIANREAREVLPFVPSIAGSCLIFLASIRISVTTLPPHLLAFGFALLIVATTFPFAAGQLFPAMKAYHWDPCSLLFLFVVRIIGIIFLSTALLRLIITKK